MGQGGSEMLINADFSQRVVIRPDDYQWVPSPAAGVERMMLDRIGKETGHATSLVRYAADSVFPPHVHTGGEEVLVLEGEFSDEHGSYPAGSYLRNPIGTKHSPKIGSDGATIFVKLHQFDEGDTRHFNIDTIYSYIAPRAICRDKNPRPEAPSYFGDRSRSTNPW